MNFNWEIILNLGWPIILIFIGAFFNNLLEKRDQLIAYIGHISSFKLDSSDDRPDPVWVYTHAIIVRNNGRKTAENVRIGHAYLPNINIPDYPYYAAILNKCCDIDVIRMESNSNHENVALYI